MNFASCAAKKCAKKILIFRSEDIHIRRVSLWNKNVQSNYLYNSDEANNI
jgi:hypothetical protein